MANHPAVGDSDALKADVVALDQFNDTRVTQRLLSADRGVAGDRPSPMGVMWLALFAARRAWCASTQYRPRTWINSG